ncbi:hypothetical protein BKA65DRAFT_474148 [Rhexocercosporidium sp. MPI-PUGE-AT-0058]|nr:hypothetical protein BKA65DRAFT_474148 [Rhexocercosporidium sp. MPI-PUGE-AT-0058]
MIIMLVSLLALASLLSAIPLFTPNPVPKPISVSKPKPVSKPGELAARYCTHWKYPSRDCMVLTLAHGTNTGSIIDIDIYNQTCHIIGSARGQSYSKKTKVPISLDKVALGPNFVNVTPNGMQGTLHPGVIYAGKKFGDDGNRCPLDRDVGGWVCTVDFEC